MFLGRFGRFDNWYKRRIKRIYPSVIAYAVVLALIGFWQMPVTQIIKGGDWFITCIMLYYVVLYFVRKWYSTKPLIPFIVAGLTIIIWYSFENSDSLFMYGSTYFKWGHYFLYMLAGAYVGGNVWQFKSKPILDALLLITCIVIFYGIQFLASKSVLLARFQILSLLPLMGIVLFTYKLCCCERLKQMMNTKGGLFLRFIAGL